MRQTQSRVNTRSTNAIGFLANTISTRSAIAYAPTTPSPVATGVTAANDIAPRTSCSPSPVATDARPAFATVVIASAGHTPALGQLAGSASATGIVTTGTDSISASVAVRATLEVR
jgi:hypothetical protein